MQMSMEHRLPRYRTAIPAQIVTLWIVFTINQYFDLRKERECRGKFFCGKIKRWLPMGFRYDDPRPLQYRVFQIDEKAQLILKSN